MFEKRAKFKEQLAEAKRTQQAALASGAAQGEDEDEEGNEDDAPLTAAGKLVGAVRDEIGAAQQHQEEEEGGEEVVEGKGDN